MVYDAIATRMAALQQAIVGACRQVSGDVKRLPTLVAASKGQSVAAIEAAIALGVTDFGENRVQEAQEKWPEIKVRHPHLRLHLIGPLQSNKVADAVALFDVIETVDRIKIADALAAEAAKTRRSLDYYIQVNIGEESQKSGVLPAELDNLLKHAREGGHLNIVGLMGVPPADANPAPYFALLAKLATRYGMKQLSMGMSHDFDVAIRLGATHVRIGTALFGTRI
ncbi:MAG: YggS family pyridoxal phosphate enzyme [Rhodospirillales bacterium 12-54-5]|nr:MAG: YggS family pyridoxal phosphate enzyme [Rhodospirillales bacterium 12-54-5]